MSELQQLVQTSIPSAREVLRDNYRNLLQVADYCESNYGEAQDKRGALEETMAFTTQSLASVAYQISNLASDILKMLDFQAAEVRKVEANVSCITQVGSDAIIRQHKAACLRITALLACKDLLWIGTSAGVVLTLSITASATSLKTPPLPVGLSQGHTGHVRFLTSIDLPEGFDVLFPLPRDPGIEKSGDLEKRDSTRHRSLKSKMLVISGGDGYEDFRLTNSSETVGRDDSTNHLLLWRV